MTLHELLPDSDILFCQSKSRRAFLKNLGALSAISLLMYTGGCESIRRTIANRPTRRRLRSGSPEVDAVIETYKEAVRLMKSLVAFDPRNWTRQATIHGTPSGFNFCHRNNREFLTWHRAYVFQFERICQRITGNKNFAVPYWNWVLDHAVPIQFREAGSNLNVPRRRTALSPVAVETFFNLSSMNDIMTDSIFYDFSEALRRGPHNSAHGDIGGGFLFGNFNSPEDPIFWTHHCMVDYCWYDWNVNRNFDNPNDDEFLNTEWDHFVDQNGGSLTCRVVDTLLLPLLSYQYEDSQISTTSSLMALKVRRDFNKLRERIKKGAAVTYAVKERLVIEQPEILALNKFSRSIRDVRSISLTTAAFRENEDERLYVNIILSELPKQNDFFVRVFVNPPSDQLENNMNSIHYAGSFAFFGTQSNHEGHHSKQEADHHKIFLVELTETLRVLKKNQILKENEPISIRLVPIPFDDQMTAENILALQKIEFVIMNVGVKKSS